MTKCTYTLKVTPGSVSVMTPLSIPLVSEAKSWMRKWEGTSAISKL